MVVKEHMSRGISKSTREIPKSGVQACTIRMYVVGCSKPVSEKSMMT